MRPRDRSHQLLGATRSRAKMHEYAVPESDFIELRQNPEKLFTLSVGMLGDFSAATNRGQGWSQHVRELREHLLFAAQFLDSFQLAKLNARKNPYAALVGSAAYYLCELPGSASVLARQVGTQCPDMGAEGVEGLLHWLLLSNGGDFKKVHSKHWQEAIQEVAEKTEHVLFSGGDAASLLRSADALRARAYAIGSPRQLFFSDLIGAVVRARIHNSAWRALPVYSGLSKESWRHCLEKPNAVRELWPAQHRLGVSEVLAGRSAVVQMPTSAGKTKATEFVIRSAFLAGRTNTAIVVTPFRALCREVRDTLCRAFTGEPIAVEELSDAVQPDFIFEQDATENSVTVVTPEKLLYLLRVSPELAGGVGLIIFDEGHQFDSGTRGIAYELLITSLRMRLPVTAQKVLISAVITNAEQLSTWLNEYPNVVDGAGLQPTSRSIGFVSWKDTLGRVEYVQRDRPTDQEFFVPRVLEEKPIKKKPKEKKDRFFPARDDGKGIALALGLKLVRSGSVAVFCGSKASAASIGKQAVDLVERDPQLELPREYSDADELQRQVYLHSQSVGTQATMTQAASLGIFLHHGNVPEGLRLAIEHGMAENLL